MRFEALRAIKPPMALVLKMVNRASVDYHKQEHFALEGSFLLIAIGISRKEEKKASLLLELGADQTSEDGGSSDVDVGGCEDGDSGNGGVGVGGGGDGGGGGGGGVGGGSGGGGGGGSIHRDATRFIMEVES
ncbi:hypothetical protein HZH68_015725 [Vespula germanica]|uniref:Uncharacterized protein n=1 Tax=Vespula germanica TaxID=30212 RepID=A0A834J783_VESGE|nr:hypothetical protein HZH68_015725 [Vespula germanica]